MAPKKRLPSWPIQENRGHLARNFENRFILVRWLDEEMALMVQFPVSGNGWKLVFDSLSNGIVYVILNTFIVDKMKWRFWEKVK